LPAFLSFYVGAEEERLPRVPSRAVQGVLVGLVVSAGFLAVFLVVGLPISYGATAVAEAVPWIGIGIGAVLAAVGLATLLGVPLTLPLATPLRARRERRVRPMLLFGVGYGLASLACTLPVFLALVGASIGVDDVDSSLVVFAAYGLGMALVLTALAVGAAFVREGLARSLRRIVPYTERIAAVLLLLAGAYVTYYWARIRFGSAATLAEDPFVGVVTKFTAEIQASGGRAGLVLVVTAAVIVLIGVVAGVRGSRRRLVE
jgi:cytochrome c-type biogenesis protein